ncbi:hypothetical protein E2651_42785 [Streptomyces sp. MZ04]|nr:hypothetical protein E2651_42785 [Streptomyces sp. MZ04]
MSEVMIRVPADVRDRLAVVAASRNMSVRALMQEVAERMLTAEERQERAERCRAYLAEHFGAEVTDEESAAVGRKVRDFFDGRQAGPKSGKGTAA